MKSTFSTPEFTSGVTSAVPQDKPNTEDRTWGEFAKDVAIDAVASPVLGAVRAGTQAWRMAEDNAETPRAVDQAVGGAVDWLKEQRSDRARALDTQSIDPRGDERSFWKEPIAGSVHALLPSVPYAAAALATAGSSIPVQAGVAGLSGAAQMGDALNDLRDYADNTPIADLQKLPTFQKFYREYNGDEIAARNALFKEMLDPKSQALNFLVNTFEVPAFRLGMRPSGTAMRIVDRARAGGLGAVVGGTQGALEGGTEAYIEQLGKVRSGQQQAINTDDIASGALSGAVFAGPVGAFHAIAPTYNKKATALGTTEQDVANQQINPQQEQPPPQAGGAPSPPGGPPGAAPPGAARPGRRRGPVTDIEEVAEEPPPGVTPPGEPPPGVAPPGAPPPREPPDVSEAMSIFKTAKGSEYFVMPDGTTIRNKSPHPEHPGDVGWQEPSQRTLYITPEHANELGGLFQATTTFGKRIAMLPDGRVGVQYTQGPSRGKFERRTVGRPLDGPQVGAMPLELWRNGVQAHFGNPITEVAHKPQPQQAAPPQQAAAPQQEAAPQPYQPTGAGQYRNPAVQSEINDLLKQVEQQGGEFTPEQQQRFDELRSYIDRNQAPPPPGGPPRFPAPYANWAGESGFTARVQVLDRPPVFQNGTWMQPVRYTQPGTRRARNMMAPFDELHEMQGPPEAAGPQLPTDEYGPHPFVGPIEQYGPPPREQSPEHKRNLVRGALAQIRQQARNRIAIQWGNILKERRLNIGDVPEQVRDQLDAGEWDALSTMLENDPQQVLGILNRRGTGALAENPVLQDLQLRQQRRAETAQLEREEEERLRREDEEERQTRPKPRPERAGIHFTGLERGLDAAIATYHRGEQTQEDWASLRSRAKRLEALRRKNGLPPANFLEELGPAPGSPEQRARNVARAHHEQLARTEAVRNRRLARQEVVEARGRRKETRAARRAERPTGYTRHPLMGGQTYEAQLRSDVEAFNKRISEKTGQPISKAAQRELDIDRRVLQERVDKFNAGAEPNERLTLDKFEPYVTQREQLQREFDNIVDQLEQATPAEMRDPGQRPHLIQLVNRLINLQRGRQYTMVEGERPREMTVREALRRRGPEVVAREQGDRIAVWTVGERWENLAKEQQKRERARRGRYAPTHVAIGEGEYLGRYGRMPVDTILIAEPTRSRTKLSISPALATQLERYGLATRPEDVMAASQRSQEDSRLLREARQRQADEIEARKHKRGRKPTGTGPAETEGLTKKEARRTVSAALKARAAEEYKPSGKPVGRRTGMSGEVWTRIFRKSWKALPGWKKLEIRQQARVQGVRNIEERIRQIVEEREADAHARELEGKPALHPFGKLPTVAEALEQFRQGMRREEGRLAQAGTEGRYVKARENVIKQSVETAIKNRFGTQKRFTDFIAKLNEESQIPRPILPSGARGARPNRLIMNAYHERLARWEKRRQQLSKDAGRLKTFLDHTIQQINKDLAGYRKSMDIKGRDSLWRLAEPIRSEEGLKPGEQVVGGKTAMVKLDRKKFRSGKVGIENARYNFANDMQNMSEGLRHMQAHLDMLGPELRSTAPQRGQRLHPTGQPRASTRFEEFNRYTAVLGKELRDFTTNFDLYLKDELKLIENERKARSEEATAGFRGVSMNQRSKYDRGVDNRREVTGMPEDFLTPSEDYEADQAGSEYSRTQQDEERAAAIAEREGAPVVGQRAIEQAGAEEKPAEAKEPAREEPFEIIPAGLNPTPQYDPITGEEIAADIHAVPGRELRGGGSRAATTRGVNIVEEQMLANAIAEINRRNALAKLKAERTGRVHDQDDISRRTAERLNREFPLRSERLKYTGKVRPGMAPLEFDDKGLPIGAVTHEEFTPYDAVMQYHMEAWNELNNMTSVEHPLIAPAVETQTVMDRIKTMAAAGHTNLVPTEYVDHAFLDRLAAITAETEVYHAPYSSVSHVGEDSPAHYNTKLDRVVLSSDVSPDLYVRAALHETVHAATERALLTDPEFLRTTQDLMRLGVAAAKRQGLDPDMMPRELYGLSTPSEFVAELASNKKFREFLFRVPAPHNAVIQGVKNVLNAAYHAIRQALRRMFGTAKDGDTALDILFYDQSTVLGQADAMLARKLKQLQREGRPSRAAAIAALGDEDAGRRYLDLSAGARAFRDGMGEMFGRAAFQASQVKNENRAPGMGWRTVFDMTKIGGEEFKKLTADFHETFERMHGTATKMKDADKREIAELASIWTGWNAEGRKMAGEMMIAEGEHTAFADAPIGEYGPEYLDQATGERKRDLIGKNAHIDPTLLKNAQVVQQHEEMQRRLADTMSKLPPKAAVGKLPGHGGFKEFRDRVYAFTEKREEEVRRNNIRDLWAVSDYIPDGLSVKERETLLDDLRDWTDTNAKLTSAQQTRLRKAGFFNNPETVDKRNKLRTTREFQPLLGPYSPFTRYGDWALSGEFRIAKPDNALLINEDIDEATGLPVNEARYVFETEAEAREMVREQSKEENGGLVQLDGGKVWIDTRTGQRPRVPDKRHAGKERLATTRDIERAASGEKGLDPDFVDALDPKHLQQYSYVTFQPKLLMMEPDQYTADLNMRALKDKYGDKLDITKPKDVFQHDGRQNDHYVSTNMQNQLNEMRASAAYQRLDPHEQAAITRQMNLSSEKFTQRRGFKQRYLPRNYVKGPTTHVLQSLDDYSTTSTRYLAKVQHSALLKEQSEDIKDYLKTHQYEQGNANFVAENRVYNALMRRLHNPTRNPHDTFVSRNIDRGLRVTMIDKLPNVAYVAVNGTETALVGGPLMAGRHGVVDTGRTIGKYYRIAGVFGRFRKAAANDIAQAFRRGTKMTNFLDLFGDALDTAAARGRAPFADAQKRLMQRAADRNLFDVSASLEYQSSFPTSRKTIDVALDYMQGLFQAVNTAVENMGRFATLTSAFDLEMRRLQRVAEGKAREHNPGEAQYTADQREKAASDYAVDILHQANGVYAGYNAPEFFTREGPLGALGPVIFQFKKWPQRITMIYLRAGLGMVQGIFKDWAAGRRMRPEYREAARQFVFMVAMVGLMAGAAGLPLEPFSHTLNLAYIMGISKYNWDDVQAGFRDWVGRKGGRDLAQLVTHGPLSYFTGLDIGRRLSQQDMWASGSPASNKPRDLNASLMTLLGGAMLGTGNELLQGVQKWGESARAASHGADDIAAKKFFEGLRHLVPFRLVSDIIGSTTSAEGTELSSGRKLNQPYTPFERIGRAIGFTPTREAEAREGRAAITSAEKRSNAMRKSYIDDFTRSPPGAQREAQWRTIQQDWNPYHPGFEITREDLLKADQSLKKARAETDKLGIPQTRRNQALMPMAEMYGYR
jgi:hypothetical protein